MSRDTFTPVSALKPRHVAKSSAESCTTPLHAPAVSWIPIVSRFIGTLKVTEIASLSTTPVAPEAGKVETTAGAVQPQDSVPVQAPATQVSTIVHELPSLQAVPGSTGANRQPRVVSQPLGAMQTFSEAQLMSKPWQTPATQLSDTLHALPSSHGFSLSGVNTGRPPLHESLVHSLPSEVTSEFSGTPHW